MVKAFDVMSTFQMKHWRLPSVHGVAKVVNTVARLPGNADSHELRKLTATADLVMLRKEPNKTILPSNHGRKHTHTPIHYCLSTCSWGYRGI